MFRRFFALAVLLCLLCAGGAVGTLAWADKQAGDRIAQGVTVQGVDVGGLTVAQAQARLQRRIADPALAAGGGHAGRQAALAGRAQGRRAAWTWPAPPCRPPRRAAATASSPAAGASSRAAAWTRTSPCRCASSAAEVERFVDGLAKAADRPATDAGFSVSVESVGITEAKPGRRLAGARGS